MIESGVARVESFGVGVLREMENCEWGTIASFGVEEEDVDYSEHCGKG